MLKIQTVTNDFGNKNCWMSPELLALDLMIKEIKNGCWFPYSVGTKVLFVIDHNLGLIDKINSGDTPIIFGDVNSYLPLNMKIMYASDKPVSDSIFNEMISECDKISNLCRTKIGM